MNNYAKQDIGYILHRRLYRESSLILEVFTREHGHITLLAKGARRAKSPWRGITQSFIPLLLAWRGSRGLSTLVMAEFNVSYCSLKGVSIFVGLYLNELLIRVLGKDIPYPGIFSEYEEILKNLGDDRSYLPHIRYFEYELLRGLGYGLCLLKEVKTEKPIIASEFYYFEPEHGFSLRPNPLKKKPNDQGIFLGESLLALHFKKLESIKSLQDAKRLLRQCLAIYLGGKKIKARELWI